MDRPVATILSVFLSIISLILFVYMILSWIEYGRQVSRNRGVLDGIDRFLYAIRPVRHFVESVSFTILKPLRRAVAPYQQGMPLDLGFMLAIVIIIFLQEVVIARIPF